MFQDGKNKTTRLLKAWLWKLYGATLAQSINQWSFKGTQIQGVIRGTGQDALSLGGRHSKNHIAEELYTGRCDVLGTIKQ